MPAEARDIDFCPYTGGPLPRWNFRLKPRAGLRRAVSDHKRDDLPGSPAQRNPKPALIRAPTDVGPAFTEFEDVAFFGRVDLIGYRFGLASLLSFRFMSHRERVFRLTPKIRLIALFDPRSR